MSKKNIYLQAKRSIIMIFVISYENKTRMIDKTDFSSSLQFPSIDERDTWSHLSEAHGLSQVCHTVIDIVVTVKWK